MKNNHNSLTKENWVGKGDIVDFIEQDDYIWCVKFSKGIDTKLYMCALSFPTLLYKIGKLNVSITDFAMSRVREHIEHWYTK
jgi:hypothetical protein